MYFNKSLFMSNTKAGNILLQSFLLLRKKKSLKILKEGKRNHNINKNKLVVFKFTAILNTNFINLFPQVCFISIWKCFCFIFISTKFKFFFIFISYKIASKFVFIVACCLQQIFHIFFF